jgi:hypothetical protein
MGKPEKRKDSRKTASKPNARSRATATRFATEAELREAADHETLGGCDLEHCQRMMRG